MFLVGKMYSESLAVLLLSRVPYSSQEAIFSKTLERSKRTKTDASPHSTYFLATCVE